MGLRHLLSSGLALAGFLFIISETQSLAKNAKEKSAPSDTIKQLASQNISIFSDHVQRSGITTCAKVIETLGARTTDTDHAVLSNWDQARPNEHLFNSLVGLNYKNKGGLKTGASIIVASPQNASSCEGMLINVLPSTLSCSELEKRLEKTGGGKKTSSLATVPVFDGKEGGSILLLPSGPSCVIVSTIQAFGSHTP